jgi:hypothetical protein
VTIVSMTSDSDSILDNVKAQHEALVQKSHKSEHKAYTFSLIWRPAVLVLIPLALTLVSIYLGFSWTEDFQFNLNTLNTAEWNYLRTNNGQGNWACLDNGTAVPQGIMLRQTVWSTDQFLDITLGFGSFEFGIAKGIDIGWDLIVGRGGQIILALLSYRVSSAVLLHSMETRTASFYTYAAVGFDRGPLFSIWVSLRDLWSGRSQGKGIISMAILASLYLLAFPTLVGVLGGSCIDLLISQPRFRP